MVILFVIVAVAGVLMFALSVVLGLIILAIAEVFFVVAYRRFSRGAKRAAG